MSSLVEEIDAYYEAKKPYTQLLKDALTSSKPREQPEEDPIPSTSNDDMEFSGLPNMEKANAEIKALLEKMEAARVTDSHGEKHAPKK